MKKIIFYSLTIVSLLFFVSCATTASGNVSTSADLSSYKYMAIKDVMEYTDGPLFYDTTILLFDELQNSTPFQMIGEKELEKLPVEEQKKAILLKYSVSTSGFGMYTLTLHTTVNLVDYVTDRPLASYTSEGAIWWGTDSEIRELTEKGFHEVLGQLKTSVNK